jgi:uncharacterized membrane protein YgcG
MLEACAMQFRRAFRFVSRVLIVAGAVASVMGGCSRQGEGERCDFKNAGHADCDDDLICTLCGKLQGSTVDRCCKADGSFLDERCQPGNNEQTGLCGSDTAGRGGSGGSAGSSGTGGGGTGGGGTGGNGGASDEPSAGDDGTGG